MNAQTSGHLAELTQLRERVRNLEKQLDGQIVDIVQQKQIEALRESEERFRHLLQSILFVAVQAYGPDGTTQYCNQASECLYGYSAEEAVGRSIPVILSSGYGEVQVLSGDHSECPQVFLHKPYQRVDLQAALAKAMEG